MPSTDKNAHIEGIDFIEMREMEMVQVARLVHCTQLTIYVFISSNVQYKLQQGSVTAIC